MPTHHTPVRDREPSSRELRAIEAEWPVIEAELEVVDAEIALLSAVRPSSLDWRRLRRSEARVIRVWIESNQTMPRAARRSLAA